MRLAQRISFCAMRGRLDNGRHFPDHIEKCLQDWRSGVFAVHGRTQETNSHASIAQCLYLLG